MLRLFILMITVTCLWLPSICSAGITDHPKLAVMPVVDQSTRHVSSEDLDNVYDLINGEFAFSQRFTMVTRNAEDIKRALDEMKFQQSGLVDPNTAVQVGKFLGAQYIVMASITGLTSNSKGGGRYVGHVSLRVVEVETAAIALAGRGTGTGDDNYETLEKTVMDAMEGKRGVLTLLRGGKR